MHGITLEKYENGVRREICGAFSRASTLTFRVTVPPERAVRDVVIRLQPDGEDWFDIPFEKDGGGVFTLSLKLAELCRDVHGGLFFYEFLFIGNETFFSDTANNNDFSLSPSNAGRFTLLVTEDGFATPRWFWGGVMYHIFVDRFARGGEVPVRADAVFNPDWENGVPQYAPYRGAPLKNNEFFGGTLWGVLSKLDDLAALGVTTLYLSPIFEAYSNHKYDTGDYRKIDEMFGGDAAFRALLDAAHKRGMHVILDGVFNHTGSDSVYFNAEGRYPCVGAAQSESSPYHRWYHFNGEGKYEAWWGIPILPRLNHDCPECREYFLGTDGVIAHYIKEGIDGWRLDVADELSDGFLDGLRTAAKGASSDALILGEVWENAATKISYGVRRRYLRGAQLDAVMNYPFRAALLDYLRLGDAAALADELTEVYATYPRTICHALMNLIGTHDTERILSLLGDDDFDGRSPDELAHRRLTPKQREKAVKRLKIAAAIQFTVYGVPSVFYGDEAGMEGYHDPFCRRPYPWQNRDLALLAHYRKLGAVRRENAVYRDGEFSVVTADAGLLLFVRTGDGERIYTAANAGESSRILTLPRPSLDLLTGERFDETVTVFAESVRILKLL